MSTGVLRWTTACFSVLWTAIASSDVVLDRTRIIYPMGTREVSVQLTNEADSPRLVQAWIDTGDAQLPPEYSDVPFTLTPPIKRIDPGKGAPLRIVYQPSEAPVPVADQEALYWLNVLSVRPTATDATGGNTLQWAIRTRIKLFLRPVALANGAADAASGLTWRLVGGQRTVVQVRNPSAFHVTLASVVLVVEGVEYPHHNPPMVAPRSATQLSFDAPLKAPSGAASLRFSTVDDSGALRHHRQPL